MYFDIQTDVMPTMVLHETKTDVADLVGALKAFPPRQDQTVKSWCEQWGYEVEGSAEGLKDLFIRAANLNGLILVLRTRLEDCMFT